MREAISIAYWLFIAVTAGPMFAISVVLFIVTLPFDRNGRIVHLYTCVWAQATFYANPLWRLKVDGREHLPWNHGAVLVANHQSLGDILVLFGLFSPFKWVSKKSVFKVPFIGWNMYLNRYVALVRGKGESIRKMLVACEGWLRRGVPVLMFPEGTRSLDEEVKAFKDGAFALAIKTGCPVIPIVLTGTARTLPKHGLVLRENARCHVQVMPPVDPKPFGGDTAALREHVRNIIVAEKRRLDQA